MDRVLVQKIVALIKMNKKLVICLNFSIFYFFADFLTFFAFFLTFFTFSVFFRLSSIIFQSSVPSILTAGA